MKLNLTTGIAGLLVFFWLTRQGSAQRLTGLGNAIGPVSLTGQQTNETITPVDEPIYQSPGLY